VTSFQETYDLFLRQYQGGVVSKLDSLRAEAAQEQWFSRGTTLQNAPRLDENGLFHLASLKGSFANLRRGLSQLLLPQRHPTPA